LVATVGGKDKNYADFREAFMACTGVCIGAFDFEWTIPRGHGTVPATEPAMFTWAPDTTPEGLSAMGFMKLKMQMPMKKSDLKAALGNWNGAFIECNGADELNPSWVVPKLRGGRMGSRKDKLNAEGMALYDQLTKEIADGGGTTESFQPVEPDAKPEPAKPEVPHTTPWKPPKTAVPDAPAEGFVAMTHDEIKAMVEEKVAQAAERKMPEIEAAAKAAARQAVEDATKAKTVLLAKEAANAVASLAFNAGADSVEG